MVKVKQATKTRRAPGYSILISQSTIKAVRDYLKKKLCGVVLEAKYIFNTFPEDGDDSAAKKLGRYFEFILSGSLGRGHTIPEPEYKKTFLDKIKRSPVPELAKKNAKLSDMTKPYQLAHKNAARVKAYFVRMKIEILRVNVTFEDPDKEGIKGTIDIIARYNGRIIVIDVKYSGLIHDKWNELGWQWTPAQRKFHGTQAVQYHKLTGYDFFFLVVSSENEFDILFDEIFIGTLDKEQHTDEVILTRKTISFIKDFGAVPYPELVRCSKCAIREGCAFKITEPQARSIYLDID